MESAMKVFVTGVNGQLGHDVMNELAKRNIDGIGSDLKSVYSGVADGSAVTAMPYVALDITDKEAVHKVIAEIHPDAVIHCAAWTAVDMAEDDDKVALVRKVNVDGTQHIADACKAVNCKMMYISTDYVFNGAVYGAMEAGLQILCSVKCVWADKTGRGTGRCQYAGQVFYCTDCLGVWPERK